MLKLLLTIFAVHTAISNCQNLAPTISIPDGQLKGTINLTVLNNITYYAYRGIPFAKAPIGNLRFASPVKNDPWTGIYDATKDKNWCTQMGQDPSTGNNSTTVIGSEDCLYISVYTTNINSSLPVMVFIYGGGFSSGTSSQIIYSPDYFIEKDVIYVAFNYRLGVFGFLSTEDTSAPGNWGLKDQVLALHWVKDNIKFFGGDPTKVTIFGESAGSASVSYLIQSNLAAGLFRGAIMESGTSICVWALTRNARNKAFQIGLGLGIFTLSSQDLVNRLRTVDYKQLKLIENNVSSLASITEGVLGGLSFGPVQEPDQPGAFFTGKSWQQLSAGAFTKVPLIIGFNSFELASFARSIGSIAPLLIPYDLEVARLAPIDLTRNYFARIGAGLEIKNHFFNVLQGLGSQPSEFATFATVELFNRPIRETVSQMSKYTNVFYYQFSYESPLGNPSQSYKGVGHADELRYLFVNRSATPSAEDILTIQRFTTLWTNFAKTGNPTPSNNGSSSLINVTWVPNTPSTNTSAAIKYLNINKTLTMEENPDQSNWEFYKYIYWRYGSPPYGTY